MARGAGRKIQRVMMSFAGNQKITQNIHHSKPIPGGALREDRFIFVTFVLMHSVANVSGGI